MEGRRFSEPRTPNPFASCQKNRRLVGLSFLAAPTAEPQLEWPEISQMSLAAAVLGAVGFFALSATARLCRGAK